MRAYRLAVLGEIVVFQETRRDHVFVNGGDEGIRTLDTVSGILP